MAPKKPARNPMPKQGKAKQEVSDPLYERRPRTFGIGGHIPPKRDVRRFVRWPRYVRLQRQKRVLMQRVKVPPALNQFNKAMDKNGAQTVLSLLMKYRPEDKAAKKERLQKEAEAKAAGKTVEKAKPMEVKFGIHHVTQLIEAKKAQLVVIAHDVDPIELVVWLPALCRKMGIPYCIIKSKARLGTVVHQKKATALAITGVRNEDQREFAKVCEMCMDQFNNASRVPWGGHILGPKAAKKLAARERLIAKELAQRAAV